MVVVLVVSEDAKSRCVYGLVWDFESELDTACSYIAPFVHALWAERGVRAVHRVAQDVWVQGLQPRHVLPEV